MSATSQRRRPGKLASCTVDFVSREFPFPTIQPTTSPRRRRGGFSSPSFAAPSAVLPLLALNSPDRLFDRSPRLISLHAYNSPGESLARSIRCVRIRDSSTDNIRIQLNITSIQYHIVGCVDRDNGLAKLFLLVSQKVARRTKEPPSPYLFGSRGDTALSYNKNIALQCIIHKERVFRRRTNVSTLVTLWSLSLLRRCIP